jgi:cysteine desulfurase/selenocysteine lyase
MKAFYDVQAIRKLFPAVEKMTYLDSGFQTPMSKPVKDALESFISESYETAGPKALWLDRVEEVRAKVAAFLGAAPGDIAFTKNTSEAMNIAANALPLKPGDNVLMVHGDHPNNTYAFLNLQRKGVQTRFIPMTETVDAESFRPFIDGRTRAISMSHVTFHAGHRFDIQSVGQLCREKGLYYILDIMQSAGLVPIDVKAVGATFVGSGTHKGLLVPHGLGILYWNRAHAELAPTYIAAASLANPPKDLIARSDDLRLLSMAGRFELGNLNLSAIQALGAALALIQSIGVENIGAHCYGLGERLIAGLDALNVRLVGPRDRALRAPHIYVAALPAGDWMDHFTANNVRVSPERDGVRISLGMFNTAADIDRFFDVVRRRLRPSARTTKAA